MLSPAKRHSKLHSNQAFPGTRLRLNVLSNTSFGRSSLQCSALTPVDGWIFIRDRAASSMFSIIEVKRTCSPRSSLLCASIFRLIWTCCFLPDLIRHTATLHQSRPCPCLFKRRIARMIPQLKRTHHRALVVENPARWSRVFHVSSRTSDDSLPLIIYFYRAHLTAEVGSTARLSFQASSADSMKEVPSIVLLWRNTAQSLAR